MGGWMSFKRTFEAHYNTVTVERVFQHSKNIHPYLTNQPESVMIVNLEQKIEKK